MPAILIGLVGLLWDVARAVLPSIVGKIMLTLGLTWATTTLVLPDLLAFVQSHASGMPAAAVSFLAYINFDKAITMILSAGVARTAGKAVLSRKSAPVA
jgi:hypothetical protein